MRYRVQASAEAFGFFHAGRADQHRLSGRVHARDFVDERRFLSRFGRIHGVRIIASDDWSVRGNDLDVELVDFAKLVRLCRRGTGHAADGGVEREQVLNRDRSEYSALLLRRDAFFHLNRRLQPCRPSPVRDTAALELVNRHDGAVLDDVVNIPAKQDVRVERILDSGEEREIAAFEEIPPIQRPLDPRDARCGQRHVSAGALHGEVNSR